MECLEHCITLGLAVTQIYCFIVFETSILGTMGVETLVLSSLLSERGGRRVVYNMSHEHSNPFTKQSLPRKTTYKRK